MDTSKLKAQWEALQAFDFNSLDMENPGSWPGPAKVVAAVFLALCALFGGYKLFIEDMMKQLENEQRREQELRQQFEAKAFKAANLPLLKVQLAEMEQSFGKLLGQLPTDTEVPGLLEDISNRGEGSRLNFNSIKLLAEQRKEFYIELPISINTQGNYHDMGSFVSGVAALPRIVTLHDFTIKPDGKTVTGLTLDILAKTYRYKEDE
ncbi:MAG TPA: type 4a pilus biogenesis protein PilO [Pseudomonadales bacterium]|nr:type 4a pilus biogenesis protein PilO [Pseudomonadales bacterium]